MAKRKKPGERWRELGRQSRILAAKRRGEKIVSDKNLRYLASLGLPNNVWVWNACLAALQKDDAT